MVGLDASPRNRPPWCSRLRHDAAGVVGQHVDPVVRARAAARRARVRRRGRRSRPGTAPGRSPRRLAHPLGRAAAGGPGPGRPAPPGRPAGPARRRRPARCRSWPRSPPRSTPSEIFHRSILPGHGARLPWRHTPLGSLSSGCTGGVGCPPDAGRSASMAASVAPAGPASPSPGSSVKMLGQGPGPPGRPGLPRPGGRGRAAGQAGRAQEHRGRAERGRLGAARPGWSGSTT